MGMARQAKRPTRLVVGVDEQDVGLFGNCQSGGKSSKEEQSQHGASVAPPDREGLSGPVGGL